MLCLIGYPVIFRNSACFKSFVPIFTVQSFYTTEKSYA